MGQFTDTNIESSHLYADQSFGEEQRRSVLLAAALSERLAREGHSVSHAVLIDDQHVESSAPRCAHELANVIRSHGGTVNWCAYESRFRHAAGILVDAIPTVRLKRIEYAEEQRIVLALRAGGRFIGLREERRGECRYTCVGLAASWALCRLGAIEIPPNAAVPLAGEILPARRIVSVLPTRYRSVEEKVRLVIQATPWADLTTRMQNIFYEERICG